MHTRPTPTTKRKGRSKSSNQHKEKARVVPFRRPLLTGLCDIFVHFFPLLFVAPLVCVGGLLHLFISLLSARALQRGKRGHVVVAPRLLCRLWTLLHFCRGVRLRLCVCVSIASFHSTRCRGGGTEGYRNGAGCRSAPSPEVTQLHHVCKSLSFASAAPYSLSLLRIPSPFPENIRPHSHTPMGLDLVASSLCQLFPRYPLQRTYKRAPLHTRKPV